MYCSSYPMVLGVRYFSTFNETLENFNEIWIFYVYFIFFCNYNWEKESVGRLWEAREAPPQSFYSKSNI